MNNLSLRPSSLVNQPALKTLFAAATGKVRFVREFVFSLGCLLLSMFITNALAADKGGATGGGTVSIDKAVGTNLTSTTCNFLKTFETSMFLKLFCGGVLLIGILQYIPTRKNGVGVMLAAIFGYLILSKFTSILGVFGMNCA